MNWLTNFVRPKIQAFIGLKNDIPDNLWTKCPKCEHMLFQKDLEKNLLVCHHCQHHLRLTLAQRLEFLFDDGKYTETQVPGVKHDPLKFRDTKKYSDRLKEYRHKTQRDDSVSVAYGLIGGQPAVVACFNFSFMGGSMGMAAGQALVTASDLAIKTGVPLIAVTASGGARMQEGILSLMQMPRTVIAVERVKEAGLPYITLLTDPTTGGVSASFAMLGDVALAEPGAIIGFAGARVIEETIRQKLPDGFQKAEYLLAHGMVDQVVHRHELKKTLSQLLKMLSVANEMPLKRFATS
ncbi:acetyl-CoA carboxylase, carboxyltransferase subunit beta [Candidatus Finniella inopinata]|uniref:Acetyl-coenzyme A carboxylase carboxyl transferase subunit beta n=1 Tax=Candidatus Finniella inopinata TaxID=1696036 RepID=A0A4Q7DGK6_9PROT|nr:acetyl-CoA carboxylase, carboxyltransferase subunit beta [Candidatus Finniella inopinata]RZI45265.1 acetyl-CoA carboxylase carboxyltransferase subunit beta [Candidatus Finniella inopinata]